MPIRQYLCPPLGPDQAEPGAARLPANARRRALYVIIKKQQRAENIIRRAVRTGVDRTAVEQWGNR